MSENKPQSGQHTDNALHIVKQKTRVHLRHLWSIIARHSNIEHLSKSAAQPKSPPYRTNQGASLFLTVLETIPYLLLTLFIFSFFWDFANISTTLWGYQLHFEGILRITAVGGLIGFGTNWLAITMLFKPIEKRPILGHGLIPAQKDRIAFRLAQAVSDDLINPEIIKKKISESQVISRYREQSTAYIKSIIDDPVFREELKQWVVVYVDEMIADPDIRSALADRILVQIEDAVHDKSFEKVALKAYSFVKGQQMQHIIEEALVQIPTSVEKGLDKMDDLLDQLPIKIEEHSEAIENIVTSLLYKLINQLDVQTLVEDNLRNYDEQHIANIIQNATNEQLRYIQYLGAVLGFIGGFIIWEPLLSGIFLLTVFGALLAADHFLFIRNKNSKG